MKGYNYIIKQLGGLIFSALLNITILFFNIVNDAEAETPILWPPDAKNWLIRKAPDAGEDWRWEEKETTEDDIVGWHHQLNGHELE